MTTHLNWFKNNICDRKTNPEADLIVDIVPYKFNEMSFHEAADYTARLIRSKHPKIYVSLSGGADSEYVVRTFHRNSIDIMPILVKTSGNEKELSYAFNLCEELQYTPIILGLSDSDYLRWYHRIVKELNGIGIYCIPPLVACEYAKENNGVLIIGEHLLDTDKISNQITPGANEWDFYNEFFIGEQYNIPFFNYTIELCCAMIKSVKDVPLHVFKAVLYGTELRPIVEYEFSEKFEVIRNVINRNRTHKLGGYHVGFGTKEKFLNDIYSKQIFH